MPREFMDDLEGEVANEKFHKCALGQDIFSADLNREDALLTNIREHRVRRVADDLGGFVGGEGIGKVSKPCFNVVFECFLALVRDGNVALGYGKHLDHINLYSKGECKMKKYVSQATKRLGTIALSFGVVLFVGIMLAFVKMTVVSIAMIALGGMFGILFLSCFLADKSRVLIIDPEKIIFPRGADKNGKTVLQKTIVKFCDIGSVDTKLYKGDGLVSEDTSFHTINLKDGTKITVTLYAYGKEAEKEILGAMKQSMN